MSEEKKLNGTVIVTYRCNARCSMCNRYKAPSKPEEEISIETIFRERRESLVLKYGVNNVNFVWELLERPLSEQSL